MGKYKSYSRQPEGPPKKTGIHPIWRGVGFILIILTPILAYFGALALLEENSLHGWVKIPNDLIAPTADPLLYVKIILTLALIFAIYIVFMLITFVLYRIFAPPRYGPYDVPPVSYRGKRYRR